MNSKHRFSRDEISKILKRAAELEHKNDIDDDSEGLTLQELEEVSKEVGIHPKYIQRAYNDLKVPAEPTSSNIFGGPFTYHSSDSAAGTFTEKEWEDIVSEIRRIHGGIGKTGKLGNTFEWEQRKQEVGYIQISLTPKKNNTKININTSYNYYASVIYSAVGTLGFALLFVLISILIKKTGLPPIPLIVAGGFGMLGLLAGARFYLSHWMKKKRRTYSKLFKRFQEMLEPDEERRNESSIKIPETKHDKNIEDEISSGRQKTS